MPKTIKKSDNRNMKKGDDTNQGVEFFYKLSCNKEFQKDLIKARNQLYINENGFINPDTRQKLWIEYKKSDMFGLLAIEQHLKEKYKIPEPYRQFIDDYIFFNRPVHALRKKPPVAMISYNSPPGFEDIEKFYDATGESYVKLIVFANASKTSLVDFIKKNWREMELGLNINIHKKHRVRISNNKERDREIRRIYRLPISELQREAEDKITKERSILVAKIIKRRNPDKKVLSAESIKRIANGK